MPTLVKDGRVVNDLWELAEQAPESIAPHSIVPLEAIDQIDRDDVGVWIDGDVEVENHIEQLTQRPLIAIRFAAFADGRGLSVAALLRIRFGYSGEIRAIGDVLPDWTPYMSRSGFDAFELATQRDAEVAIECMARFKEHYQGSVVEPRPAFRRHSLS